ncbi:MAG: two-component sensor histidine kinase, partial [Lachnospiraceae bacterium]|nr:two-component sensor histidine kinase [Lachnospiraceae bacterium]
GLKEGVNDDPESRDFYCDVIMDEAVKMNTLVKKILSLNKLEYGEDQLEISRFDITKMISGVLAASEVLAEGREIKVEFDAVTTHFVYADEYMTEEVITNYVSNAYHYVTGENIIKVSLKETGNALRFAVYNSGSHIDDENIPKVWEKFFKVDKARTREYGGSGIGLSIVKAIMELHHRDCGVRNIDDGVEFWADFDCMADSRISDKEVKENDSDN